MILIYYYQKENDRTKIIHTYKLNIYSMIFNISIEQKKKMLELGYNEMKEHFSNLQCSCFNEFILLY